MKEFWNDRYGAPEYAYGREPNVFFARCLEAYPVSDSILLPAEGEGRNAVHAARQGLQVTACDISEAGRDKAMTLAAEHGVQLRYEVGDIRTLDLDREHYHAAALIYAHFAPEVRAGIHQRVVDHLAPGGLLFLEAFSKQNLPLRLADPRVGGPDREDMLHSTEQVLEDFAGLEVLELQEMGIDLREGPYHQGRARVVRFVGRKAP